MENPKTPDYGTGAGGTIKPPRDKWNGVFIGFVLLGMGLLFPWNTILSSQPFFVLRFPKGFESTMSAIYQTTNLIGLFIIVLVGHKVSYKSRIVPGFLLFSAIMSTIGWLHSETFALVLIGVIGFSDSLVQGSVFALAGTFSAKYVGAVMAGLGVSGVSVAALGIMVKLIGSTGNQDQSTIRNTIIFFYLSVAVMVIATAFYLFVVERSPVTKFFRSMVQQGDEHMTETDTRARAYTVQIFDTDASDTHPFSTRDPDEYASLLSPLDPEHGQVAGLADGAKPFYETRTGNWQVFKKIWPMGICVFLIFFVTLALFPGLAVYVTSTHTSQRTPYSDENGKCFANCDGDAWFVTLYLATFQLGDLIGRCTPSLGPKFILFRKKGVIVGTILRLGFLPLFVLAIINYQWNDLLKYLIMFGMAVSNGYISTIAMMEGPDAVPPHEKEQAGTIMIFLLTVGLTAGVWAGVVLKNIIEPILCRQADPTIYGMGAAQCQELLG